MVHLVDLENVVGSGHVIESDARRVRDLYLRSGVVTTGDQVIIGVSHHNELAAGYGWPEARRVVLSGQDGADLALQAVMASEGIDRRFGACLLSSGDGGFAHPVASLIKLGLPVGVIAPKGRLAAGLRLAASAVCEVDFAFGGLYAQRSA